MRKILTKIMSVAMATAVAVSTITFAPATVSAAKGDKATLGKWMLWQSGECTWDAGDYSQLGSLLFADGESYSKDDLRTCKAVNKGTNDKPAWELIEATNRFENSSDGFTANILSNGWQADYAPIDAYAKNNPWSLRMENIGIKANFGEVYNLKFDAVVTESNDFAKKYANIVVKDSDTNILYAQTIVITKETQSFNCEFSVLYTDVLDFQIFLGAFPIPYDASHTSVDPLITTPEANFNGTVKFSNIQLVDTGVKDSRLATVKFVDGSKVVKTVNVNTEADATITPVTLKKKGYTFEGWYNGSSKFNFNNSVSKDMTLTAKWKKVTKPAQVKTPKVASNKAKQITVTIKKVKNASGYEYYLMNSKGKKVKSVTSSKTKYTFKKLKSGQKYSVKVRAYAKDSTGKKYNSKKWSKKKSCYAN